MMVSLFKHCCHLLLWGLKLTGFAAYGALRLCLGVARLPGRIRSARRLLGQSITCPWCDEENPLAGRWLCRSCHGQFLGDATAECPVCGATASYIPCRHCHGSIVLRGQG